MREIRAETSKERASERDKRRETEPSREVFQTGRPWPGRSSVGIEWEISEDRRAKELALAGAGSALINRAIADSLRAFACRSRAFCLGDFATAAEGAAFCAQVMRDATRRTSGLLVSRTWPPRTSVLIYFRGTRRRS